MSSPTAIRYFDKENPDDVVQTYYYLKEGDYEKYQPDVYLGRWSLEYYKKLLAAVENMINAVWRLNRYTIHGSEAWEQNIIHMNSLYPVYESIEETIKQLKKDPLLIWRQLHPDDWQDFAWKKYQEDQEHKGFNS